MAAPPGGKAARYANDRRIFTGAPLFRDGGVKIGRAGAKEAARPAER